MKQQYKYLFGPVPSRRLGRSLGVDIVPMKTCTQNCLYCQLGLDGVTTLERKVYVPASAVLEELAGKIEEGLQADYITLSGSGEPTLNSELGLLIDGIRRLTDIPIAVITNGTLFSDIQVRRDCSKADVVLPSLDAGDAETLARVNQPHEGIDFNTFVEGLRQFREEFDGEIWLEVFLIDGVNDSEQSINRIRAIIETMSPDRIQLNTAVRPVAHEEVRAVPEERLLEIANMMGDRAEVVASYSGRHVESDTSSRDVRATVLETIRRRPCTLEDLCAGLGIHRAHITKELTLLQEEGLIRNDHREGKLYFQSI